MWVSVNPAFGGIRVCPREPTRIAEGASIVERMTS
jgi:hypothetical protein